MATSGSSNLSLTASQIVEYALRKINVLAEAQSASAEASDRALTELEVMLKEWMRYPAIWRLSEFSVTPTANTASIALTTANPYRVVDCRFRNTSALDLPMEQLTRQEYYDLPNKLSTGIPTSFYFDAQREAPTLYIWPVMASVTTETIRCTGQRRIEDIDDLDNNVDVDQEHLSTVGYNLAARLADDYGRKGPHIDRVIARAEQLKADMIDMDRPEVIRFVPETRYG